MSTRTPYPTLFANLSSGYHSELLSLLKNKMRATLPATLLLSALLAACASSRDLPNKHPAQSGPLKVHPGLVGQAVPAELQEPQPAVASGTETNSAPAAAPLAAQPVAKVEQANLRTQRSVYFDYKSSAVRAEFNPVLQAHAHYLAANPKSRIRIEGNADDRGTPDFNARLGLERAENVRQILIGHGAPEKQITFKSLGETQPKLKGRDEESRAENRRADVVYEKEE
ncbi:MAG TPA: OmpA family protein [Azonexus sp.]|nr:OmpA family protein [Azonexus sp.]